MAKFVVGDGLDNFVERLEELNEATEDILGKAIYEGARVVADSVKAAINELPTVDDDAYGTDSKPIKGLRNYQKQGLIDGMGIASMRNDNGLLNVKIGFDGYNGHATKTWPQGEPNVVIARSLESGTSWREKHPFVTNAVAACRDKAEKAMENKLNEELEKALGEGG
mgnify:FL=1|nr:MAG TPA: hypothetical protein [Caudoviricetes sp.]